MEKDTPLYGTISHDGGRFTVHYEKQPPCSDGRLEGYNFDAFNDCPDDMPVVRFDQADIGDVFLWLRQSYICKEHSNANQGWKVMSLIDFIGIFANYSIPVEELRITRQSFFG